MKRIMMFLVCFGLFFSLISCGKNSLPTGPNLPDNVFKITDIQNKAYDMGWYIAIANYSNYDEEASVAGKIFFGDGTSADLKGPNIKKGTGTWQSYDQIHHYETKGTYRVKVELTAYFKRGAITSTFEKDFNIE